MDINELIETIECYHDGDLLALADIQDSLGTLKLTPPLPERPGSEFARYLNKNAAKISKLADSGAFLRALNELLAEANVRQKEPEADLWKDLSGRAALLKSWLDSGENPGMKTPKALEKLHEDPDTEIMFTSADEEKLDYTQLIVEKSILDAYIQEAGEHLDGAQFSLLDLEYDTTNEEAINVVFRCFHTIKSSSAFLGIKNIEVLAHQMENMLSLIRKGEMRISSDLTDILFYGIGFIRDLVKIIQDSDYNAKEIVSSFNTMKIAPLINLIHQIVIHYKDKKLGEILEDMGKIDNRLISQILKNQQKDEKKFGEIAVEKNLISRDDLDVAVKKQESIRLKQSYVRVSAERLNTLVDMVGELVVNQSMLREEVWRKSDNLADRDVQQMESITTSIKNIVLSMGMVPIAEVFQKLRVVIRNVGRELDKVININIEGEDTELDRNLVEAIYDPLVHIVRNAVSHGLETREEREAAGKPLVGTIIITARYKGNGIELVVSDDGGGIDRERVFEKALELQMVKEDQRESMVNDTKTLYSFLFKPGFSTKKQADSVSGRGVGLDVVEQNISRINGRVEIQSEEGVGTSFIIKLPLTLAIIDGFVTELQGERYIIPFNLIDEILVPKDVEINTLENGLDMLRNRNKYVPVVNLRKLINRSEEDYPERFVYVLVNYDDNLYALAVDKVLGKQEIVIKNLNEVLSRMELFSSGTIFGDGSIGFILDMEEIIHRTDAQYD